MITCLASALVTIPAATARPSACPLQRGARPRASRRAAWLAVLLFALAGVAGCSGIMYTQNPGFCCVDLAQCHAAGATEPIACENAGDVCDVSRNRCVPAECSLDEECADPARPICAGGRCAPCADDRSCAMMAGRPICDSGACRACRPGDCASDVCDGDTGACVDSLEVAYVSTAGQDIGPCTHAAPCRTIGRALDQLGARRFIRVAAAAEPYAEAAAGGAAVSITDKIVTILGAGATLTTIRYGDTALLIGGAAAVVVDGLRIADAGGPTGDGVTCMGVGLSTPALTLRSTEVQNNGGRGISSTACNLVIDRSTIAHNPGGGVTLSGGTVTLLNNVIANNGSATSGFGGVLLSQISTAWSHQVAFNTITANRGAASAVTGVSCNAVAIPMRFTSNIVYGNQVMGAGAQVGGSNCVFTYSDIGPQAALGTGNINADPLFVDPASEDYHLQASSPAKDTGDPAASLGVDIDGDRRPQGGRADIGADEVPQ